MSILISPPKNAGSCKLFSCTQDPSESQEKFITDFGAGTGSDL